MVQGGMGIAAGGNIIRRGPAMFEPIGGSAPKIIRTKVLLTRWPPFVRAR